MESEILAHIDQAHDVFGNICPPNSQLVFSLFASSYAHEQVAIFKHKTVPLIDQPVLCILLPLKLRST
jgi:hypothetical protein